MDRGDLVPDDVTIEMVKLRLHEDDAERRLPARRLPAHRAAGRGARRRPARAGHQARRRARAGRRRRRGHPPALRPAHLPQLQPHLARRLRPAGRSPGVCDIDGGELFQRDDDQAETIANRLAVYADSTAPLVAYYASRGVLVGIDATGPVDDVTRARHRRAALVPRRLTGAPRRRPRGVTVKDAEQVELMRAAGLVVARTLQRVLAGGAAGRDHRQLDALAGAEHPRRGRGALLPRLPRLPRLDLRLGRRRRSCTASRRRRGSCRRACCCPIDCGAILDGWHGDAAVTVPVGECAPEVLALSAVTEQAMWAGLAAVRPGRAPVRHRRGGRARRAPARLRPARGLHRARHRHLHARAAERAEPRAGAARARDGARGRHRARGRADGRARQPRRRRARRRLDGRHPRRAAGRALGAHRRGHAGRAVGAHRPRRRRAGLAGV